MEVRHCLATVGPVVHDEPVAGGGKSFRSSHVGGHLHKPSAQLGVGFRKLEDVREVLPAQYEHVHGSLRIDITNGDSIVGRGHNRRGNLPGNDPATFTMAT